MNSLEQNLKIQHILEEIDRLIKEISLVRSEVAALQSSTTQAEHLIREAEYFGMWADRDDIAGQSSREWLQHLLTQQWSRS
jgi:hypothetical protein